MARIEQTTRNGDTLTTWTTSQAEIERAENAPFDDSSNILITRVTE
jgi:hypothetical protein